jgi:acyl-CoA synthetase (AMP-forming)/AMP-acid ligase II
LNLRPAAPHATGFTISEAEIPDFCKDRIAHFRIPKYIWFVDEFPMTVTGKLQKFSMRAIAIEKLGLSMQGSGANSWPSIRFVWISPGLLVRSLYC